MIDSTEYARRLFVAWRELGAKVAAGDPAAYAKLRRLTGAPDEPTADV